MNWLMEKLKKHWEKVLIEREKAQVARITGQARTKRIYKEAYAAELAKLRKEKAEKKGLSNAKSAVQPRTEKIKKFAEGIGEGLGEIKPTHAENSYFNGDNPLQGTWFDFSDQKKPKKPKPRKRKNKTVIVEVK